MAEESKTFLTGIVDGFTSLANNAGTLANAYQQLTGKAGSATPGANGAGAPAAQSAPAATAPGKSILMTIGIGLVTALAVLLGVKLIKG